MNQAGPVSTMARRVAPALLVVLALVTPLHTALLTAYASVDVPIQDQFAMVSLLERWEEGTLSWSHLWALHNEHRPLVPRVVMVGLARLTDWNIRAEIALVWLLAAATCALLVRLLRSSGRPEASWAIPALTACLFSFAQYENWLWGACVAMVGGVTLVIGALVALASPGRATFACAAACASAATLSMASGLVTWPAGLVVLGLAHTGVERSRRLAVWSVLGALLWALYFSDYAPEGAREHPGLALLPAAIVYVLAFLGALVGAPLGVAGAALVGAGALGLVVACGLPRATDTPERRRRHAAWIGIAVWSLIVGTLCAYGRLVPFGTFHALASSRYLAYTAPFWCAVVGLVVDRAADAPVAWRRSAAALVAVVGLVAFGRGLAQQDFALRWRRSMTTLANLAAAGDRTAYIHLNVYDDVELTARRMEFLRRNDLSLFRER